jgi:aminopeptidase N
VTRHCYAYDSHNNITELAIYQGDDLVRKIENEYDQHNNLINEVEENFTSIKGNPPMPGYTHYKYDDQNRLIMLQQNDLQIRYEYETE